MKERILKLCKRLDKFSLDEISTIADDINESVISFILMHLVQEGKLIEKDNIYFYNKQNKKTNDKILNYYNSSVIDLIIKCYCLSIPSYKIVNLLGIGENQALRIYNLFREKIYNKQLNELNIKYNENPKKPRTKLYFNKPIYFYIYNSNAYICKNSLNYGVEKQNSKEDIKEFKKIYSYLTRIDEHNKNKIHLYNKIAEALWKRNKSFDELYESLKNIMNM